MVDSLVNTLTFFWCQVAIMIEEFHRCDERQDVFETYLLPMAYIEAHIPKSRNAKQKEQRKDLHHEWERKLNDIDIWQRKTAEQKKT